jgi:hypothetical protein
VLTIWYWSAVLAFGGVAASFVRVPVVLWGMAAALALGGLLSFIPSRRPALAAEEPAADVVDLDAVRKRGA